MVMREMTEHEADIDDLDLALALRRLADQTGVPPIDPVRQAALLAAFDAARLERAAPVRNSALGYWGMAGLASAAALLIGVGLVPVRAGRHGTPAGGNRAMQEPSSASLRDAQPDVERVGEFLMVPGAAALPPMESGSLVRVEVPVSMLLSLGVTPPANAVTRVR